MAAIIELTSASCNLEAFPTGWSSGFRHMNASGFELSQRLVSGSGAGRVMIVPTC